MAEQEMMSVEQVDYAWRKFDHWFFRECNEGTRRHLFALFGLPVDEIRNHGTERIALKHIRRRLAATKAADDRARVVTEALAKADSVISQVATMSNADWSEVRDDPAAMIETIHAETSTIIGDVLRRQADARAALAEAGGRVSDH